MKKVLVFGLGLMMASGLFAQKTPKTPVKTKVVSDQAMKTLVDSFSYAAGINVARNMKEQGISGINIALMAKAIEEVFSNKAGILSDELVNSCLQRQMGVFSQAKMNAEKARGVAFLEANKKKPGVVVLPDGVQYMVLEPGDANTNKPKLTDTVIIHYIGTTIDGIEFDNTVKRSQPAVYPVNGFIKGWSEILQMMPVGAKWKVFIPSEMAYGEQGAGNGAIPPNAALVFEMNLLGIKPAAEAPKN